MDNPIVPREVTEVQHATKDQIYELNEKIMETSSEVTKANEALDLLYGSLVILENAVTEYNKKKSDAQSKMQKLNAQM